MDKEAKRSLIMKYHNEGKSTSEISKILSINRWIVYRTIKRYEETGSIQDRLRKGRPRSVRTSAVRNLIRERVRKNPDRSIQGMAKDFNISTRSMGRIVKEDIGLKCQQDSAPSHKAKMTSEWLKLNVPDFISTEEWPASSPDLNPMDFCIWSILESRVCAKPHKNIESLKIRPQMSET